jgi:hypothetical protein
MVKNAMVNKIFKSIFRIFILLLVCLLAIGLLVSRPVFVKKVTDETNAFINAEDLKRHVMFLSETALPRNSANPENLKIVAEYIKTQFSLSTPNVNFQSYPIRGLEYHNVIANFGPDKQDIIIIGAHYDAFSTYPGADDNASGVSGLIELGKLLSKIELKHRVVLVAYTLEEPPYFATDKMGSFVHASSLLNNNVRLMISLEMIGYFSDVDSSQSFPVPLLSFFYPKQGSFIAVADSLMSNNAMGLKASINRFTDLPAYSINAPRWVPGMDFSDHRSYWHFGYPAIMVTDTAFYRNKKYHEQEDTYDRLNYKSMAKVIYGVFKYIQILDGEI